MRETVLAWRIAFDSCRVFLQTAMGRNLSAGITVTRHDHADPPPPHRRPRSRALLIGVAFDRLAPAKGVTTAAADAVESAAESSGLRIWWRAANRSGHGHRPRAHRGRRDDDRRGLRGRSPGAARARQLHAVGDRLERRGLGQRARHAPLHAPALLGDRSRRLADRPPDRDPRSSSTSGAAPRAATCARSCSSSTPATSASRTASRRSSIAPGRRSTRSPRRSARRSRAGIPRRRRPSMRHSR